MSRTRAALLGLAVGVLTACSKEPVPRAPEPVRLSLEQLQDPETCRGCHFKQYNEWASSMHAYASIDPVFIAMNKRGQRETKGELGTFCVQCHAPMALRNGLTQDGLNLAEVAPGQQGVTCYFCHDALGSGPRHFNADVQLANDAVMRGSIRDAIDPGVHGVAYSEAHDGRKMAASDLCGACHDIVNPKGAAIERTYQEYSESIHSIARVENKGGDTCQGCHMPWLQTGPIAEMPGVDLPARDRHSHLMPAVDVALTDFPDRAWQRQMTECALSEDGVYVFALRHDGAGGFNIALETTAGHAQPSGATIDRRMWLEVIAYDARDQVLFQSGVIGAEEIEERAPEDPRHDRQLCMFSERWDDEHGHEVHMLWEPKTRRERDSRQLPIATEFGANHVANCAYQTPGRQVPARLTARVMMRPIAMSVLQDLVASGDLAAELLGQMPTFAIQTTAIEWTPALGDSLYLPKHERKAAACKR
ncbi:MAG TPA: multiheme c-type cytochrome [Polyangiales bacterium]|nr:multiheme c-type cytochrome [Polyangiales bacterium]